MQDPDIVPSPVSAEEILSELDEEVQEIGGEILEEGSFFQPQGLVHNIYSKFRLASEARRNAGVDDILQECLYASEGKYTPSQLAAIAEANQEPVYYPLTNVKIRAGQAHLKKLYIIEDSPAWSLSSSENAELPERLVKDLRKALEEEAKKLDANPEYQEERNKAIRAQLSAIKDLEAQRVLEDSLAKEIEYHADHELKKISKVIEGDLRRGGFAQAFEEFLSNFVIFPVGCLKGPMLSKGSKIVWENGEAVEKEVTLFNVYAPSPLDLYPAPNASTPQEGDFFIERIRLGKEDVYAMSKIRNGCYNVPELKILVEDGPRGDGNLDQPIDTSRADIEKAGDVTKWRDGLYHGLHFFGFFSGKELESVDYEFEDCRGLIHDELYHVEAIILDGKLVKLKFLDNPLGRRPYYTAGYQEVPGSFWKEGVVQILSNIQKLANAAVRAIVTNMAYSAGPIGTVIIDRLINQTDGSDIQPLTMIEVEESPGPGVGKPVEFHTIPTTLVENLKALQFFDNVSDEQTGLYRQTYGSQSQVTGVAGTARGFAMLLENASVLMAHVVSHIDTGVIIPFIEEQFRQTVRNSEKLKYTGDLNVIAHGSTTLAMKAAIEAKQRELLALTANAEDIKTIGREGRAKMIGQLAEASKFEGKVVPNQLEIKNQIREEKAKEEKAMQMQAQKNSAGLEATKMQVEGQMRMHQESLQVQLQKLQAEMQKEQAKLQLEVERLRTRLQEAQIKSRGDIEARRVTAEGHKDATKLKAAVEAQLKTH